MGENVLKFGTYVRVGNAAEAYELLQKNRNNKIVGGGIWMRLGSRRVATAIDLSACGLDQIEETETEFRIGAMCTLRQLERHAELNVLVNHVFEFAVHDIVGVQLRNTATVGGSIYGRFGFSDVLSAFLALDSYVELTGAGRVPLAEFVDLEDHHHSGCRRAVWRLAVPSRRRPVPRYRRLRDSRLRRSARR